MIKPTIHLNGTPRDRLVEQFTIASNILWHALDALGDAAPNARDYYPQGEAAFNEATAEHAARTAKLRSVLDDLEALAESAANAGSLRNPEP